MSLMLIPVDSQYRVKVHEFYMPICLKSFLCLFSLQIFNRAALMKKSNGAYFPEEVCANIIDFPKSWIFVKCFACSLWKCLALLRNSASGLLNYCWQ